MSAISTSSFSFRSSQGATLASAQLTQRSGNTYGSYSGSRMNSAATAAASRSGSSFAASSTATTGRIGSANNASSGTRLNSSATNATGRSSTGAAYNNTGTGSAYCPTCGGNVSRSASSGSSSYCPTCNRTGGTQTNVTRSATAATGSDHAHNFGQGGRVCVTCGYQR